MSELPRRSTRYLLIRASAAETIPVREVGLGHLAFTVDDRGLWSALPTEQGDHADYGKGRGSASIRIEICDSAALHGRPPYRPGARLTAFLIRRYNIPVRNIVRICISRAGTSATASRARGSSCNETVPLRAAGGSEQGGTVLLLRW